MSPAGASRRVATIEIDVTSGDVRRIERAGEADAGALALRDADVWELVLTLDGRPCAQLELPDPGADLGAGPIEAAVLAACRAERSRELIARSLRRRIGAPNPQDPSVRLSIVVCTRGRPESLATLLDALSRLEPPPGEVVIVDSAPMPGEDCRDLATRVGAVYVRQDRPGLNRARNAGIEAATGELVALTDDDCVPPQRWLAVVPELFADRAVGAATGPAFPAALDTSAQIRFERVASFSRGLARRDWDFTGLSPPLATRAGAGANLVLRREALAQAGDVFPPELDAGTPTRSGGDAYALFKLLAAGSRVVYDPRLYTYHRHRADSRRLHEAIRGYGVGLGALAAKLLIEDREPDAIRIYRWLIGQYIAAVAGGRFGVRDPLEARLAWEYLRGGLAGPGAWRRSRRQEIGHADAAPAEAQHTDDVPVTDAAEANGAEATAPAVSVIVITNRPGELPEACLNALAEQTGAPAFETILVDDSPGARAPQTQAPRGLGVRRIRTGGLGAAAARNAGAEAARGELLLFLDDDLVPAGDLLAAHASRHRDEASETVVIGYSPPRPRLRNLVSLVASLWWEDHFRAREQEAGPTFTDMLSGNVSVRMHTFERIGSFDPEFGTCRREDWEWGIRALGAGVGIAYERHAVADHRFCLDSRARLDSARAEGAGDALLATRHPFALASLPGAAPPRLDGVLARLAFRLLVRDRWRTAALPLFDALERLRLRPAWARWFRVAQEAAYESGFRRARIREGELPTVTVDLCSDEPISPPNVAAPAVKLELDGVAVGGVTAVDGQWSRLLADHAAARIPRAVLEDPGTCVDGDPRLQAAATEPVLIATTPGRRDRASWWQDTDRQVSECAGEHVIVPLDVGELTDAAVQRIRPLLAGDRVAMVTGGALTRGRPSGPALYSRATINGRFPVIGTVSRYVALRREAYEAIGGFDPGVASLGEAAPVLDLLDRALEGGWVVCHCDVPGLPQVAAGARRSVRRGEFERWLARGALMRGRARDLGARWWAANGLGPVLAMLVTAIRRGRPHRLGAAGRTAAFLIGSLRRPDIRVGRG